MECQLRQYSIARSIDWFVVLVSSIRSRHEVISRKKFTVIRASTSLSPLPDRVVDFDCAQSTESNRTITKFGYFLD
jgi:hypothetical protein